MNRTLPKRSRARKGAVSSRYTQVHEKHTTSSRNIDFFETGFSTGQRKFPVFAESETEFFLKVVNAQLEFEKDDQSAVTAVILHQNGRDQTAKQISDTVAEKQEVAVAAEILASYVGSYEFKPGVDMVVTLEDGKLVTQLGRQPKVPIFAESETSFFAKVVDATIEFEKDETGTVAALVLHQGPNNIRVPRN